MKSRINFKALFTLIVIVFAFNTYKAKAQEGFASVTDSLASELEQVKSDVSKLKKLKISGYIQAQSQWADSMPGKFTSGDFKDANGGIQNNRFKVRRGRIKFAYDTDNFQYGLQFQIDETGTLATKEIYGVFTEPFLKAFSLTGGVFNRPFGYEIDYSSSLRETPEFSRFTQTLFPNEQDMGFMFTFNPAKGSTYDFIKVQAGWFAGNGMNADVHTKKDFIGRAGFSKPISEDKIKIGAGISYYNGGTFLGTSKLYTADGSNGFTLSNVPDNKNSYAKREYFGLDGQFSAATPFGLTSIRAEYTWGTQSSTDRVYGISPTAAAPTADVYQREFAGYYVYFVQNILNSKHSFVVKYDSYDPNTAVAGSDIKYSKSFTNADVMYTTLGIGYIFNVNANVKLTAYYEMPKVESTGLVVNNKVSNNTAVGTGTSANLTTGVSNVLTVRVQYKF